jgi:hypothetical protein
MKTPVPNEKLQKLWERPLPTYVVGADVVDELIHVSPAFPKDGKYSSSIPPRLRIDNQNVANDIKALELLKKDIINYYQSLQIEDYKKKYLTTIP